LAVWLLFSVRLPFVNDRVEYDKPLAAGDVVDFGKGPALHDSCCRMELPC